MQYSLLAVKYCTWFGEKIDNSTKIIVNKKTDYLIIILCVPEFKCASKLFVCQPIFTKGKINTITENYFVFISVEKNNEQVNYLYFSTYLPEIN